MGGIERLGMRCQWIKRLLANDLVDSDEVMAPYGREVLECVAASGRAGVAAGVAGLSAPLRDIFDEMRPAPARPLDNDAPPPQSNW
ncbi:hypothetical protein [Magnetospirillum sp. SS-4]|uniref:hypothetical protein n=1 Tax=Magnetospirillum sp. SS-4 TaxID=2681465 RepID=UPI00137FB549|nr:hypothetical protein [Magnetospirillum sp. SS-4]CAA7617812.1 hypothetical protein MTBSS4_200022 [Magnetospirillum sp. SS-4]